MPGVAGFTPLDHVPVEYVDAVAGSPTYNVPHTGMHNAEVDAINLVAAAVPTLLTDLTGDVTATAPDPGDGFGWDAITGKWGPKPQFAPLPHGASHGPAGDDPVAGLQFVPLIARYVVATGWPLRAAVTTDVTRMVMWVSDTAGVAPPASGGGYAVTGVDMTIIANA